MEDTKDHNGLTRDLKIIISPESDVQPGMSKSLRCLDDEILRAQGHEAVLKRSFTLISSLGLAFDITNSWVGALSNFGQGLRYGGSQVALFSIIAACGVQWIITLGLSEIASAFPSSGGQYHFVYIISPEKSKRFGAFVTGWMSILGWWIGACSGLSLTSTSILGLAQFMHPSFEIKQWHEYCVYLATLVVTVTPVIVCPRQMPRFTSWGLFLTLSGFLIWLVVILAMRTQTNSGETMFQSGQGTSGWNPGTAWMLGILNSMYCFTGTDGPIHIAEEMFSPGRRLPQIMNLTMAIGVVTTVPIIAVMMVCMKDMNGVMNAEMPAIELLYQVSNSRDVCVGLTVLLIFIYASNLPPQWITCGRLLWSFARDRGTPYAEFFSYVDEKRQFPLRATLAATAFGAIYGLLYLASTTAFNSIITSAVFLLNLSYAVPQAIMVFRGRDKCLPRRPLNLGLWGYLCNVFAPLWIMIMCVLVSMPPELPVFTTSMNYTAPILLGLFLIILCFWFTTGRQFEGPSIDWEALNLNNECENHPE